MQNKKAQKGFTLVEIMIVVAIIGLLAAIAIPNFVRAREAAQANACINNLRQIDGAKQQWALETRQATNATPDMDAIAPYLGRGVAAATAIACPAMGTGKTLVECYTINNIATAPQCKSGVATHILQ